MSGTGLSLWQSPLLPGQSPPSPPVIWPPNTARPVALAPLPLSLQQDVAGLDFVTMVNRIVEPMIAFERRYPAFRHLNAGQEGAGVLAKAGKGVEQEVLATIFDLLHRIAPELEAAKGWQVAKVTKALYKGMSYLTQQENEINSSGGDVDLLLADIKRVMADYLASQLL